MRRGIANELNDPPEEIENLLERKDKRCNADRNFLIVKSIGLTRKDLQPALFFAPFPERLAERDGGTVRRRITPDEGRGLEKLGHALDYLTDEFVCDGCRFAEDRGRLQAIELLASLNRQLYFACSVEPSFRERAQSLFRRLFKLAYLSN